MPQVGPLESWWLLNCSAKRKEVWNMTECNQVAVVLLISIWLCNGWWLHLNCQDNLRQIDKPVIFDILFHIFVTTV